MLKIHVPDSSYSQTKVALGGESYTFEFAYNNKSKRYYLSIYQQGRLLISNLKLVDNVLLLDKYDIPEFRHGDLIVMKLKETSEPVGRNNLGVDLAYSLFYIPFVDS